MPQKIIIGTADTDVVVLAISAVEEIKVEELRIAFGTGKHFRYIATHAIVLVQTNQELYLPFTRLWHGLTLWQDRITEGLDHMDCIPNSDVGFFRTWC